MRRSSAWLIVAATLASSCAKRDDGTDPVEQETLPALTLRDDTPMLHLTWVDEKGATHVVTAVAHVPSEGRKAVRVIIADKDAGSGQLLYVADLTAKQPDGSYPVKTMPRAEWEAMIEARRPKLAPPPAPPPRAPASGGQAPDSAPAPSGSVHAIVYGAAWCGPCHQARAFLKKRGVDVAFYDIEKEPSRAAEMKRKLESIRRVGGSIPVIDVAGQVFVGFNPTLLDQAIAKARKEAGTPLVAALQTRHQCAAPTLPHRQVRGRPGTSKPMALPDRSHGRAVHLAGSRRDDRAELCVHP